MKCTNCKRICDPRIFEPRTECDFSNREKMYRDTHCHYLEPCRKCGKEICSNCLGYDCLSKFGEEHICITCCIVISINRECNDDSNDDSNDE